jgi:hypothetical protein
LLSLRLHFRLPIFGPPGPDRHCECRGSSLLTPPALPLSLPLPRAHPLLTLARHPRRSRLE